MQIANNTVVTIDYTLTTDKGEEVDSSQGREPLAYVHGTGTIIPGLEEALEGKEAGEELNVAVPPEKAYGERSDEMVQEISKEHFQTDQEIEPGMRFQAVSDQGTQILTVVDISDENVKVDANHPLAGENLNFDVKVVDVREASDQEKETGQVESKEE